MLKCLLSVSLSGVVLTGPAAAEALIPAESAP